MARKPSAAAVVTKGVDSEKIVGKCSRVLRAPMAITTAAGSYGTREERRRRGPWQGTVVAAGWTPSKDGSSPSLSVVHFLRLVKTII